MNKNLKPSINTLVKKIAEKDQSALEELYNSTYKIIFSFLRRYTNNVEVIKDTISMTFLTIIEKATNKLVFINCFSWIITISKNHLFNNLRKLNKSNYLDGIKEGEDKTKGDLLLKPDIKRYIDKLSPLDKQILYLKFYQNLKINSIVKILSLSKSTVIRKLKSTYKELKEYIENE